MGGRQKNSPPYICQETLADSLQMGGGVGGGGWGGGGCGGAGEEDTSRSCIMHIQVLRHVICWQPCYAHMYL